MLSPADAVIASGSEVAYPSRTTDFHYEAELVVAIGRSGALMAGFSTGTAFAKAEWARRMEERIKADARIGAS